MAAEPSGAGIYMWPVRVWSLDYSGGADLGQGSEGYPRMLSDVRRLLSLSVSIDDQYGFCSWASFGSV